MHISDFSNFHRWKCLDGSCQFLHIGHVCNVLFICQEMSALIENSCTMILPNFGRKEHVIWNVCELQWKPVLEAWQRESISASWLISRRKWESVLMHLNQVCRLSRNCFVVYFLSRISWGLNWTHTVLSNHMYTFQEFSIPTFYLKDPTIHKGQLYLKTTLFSR